MDPVILDRITERQTARIVEGFTILDNPISDLRCRFYSEINVDNSKRWKLFKSLLTLLPEKVSFIIGYTDTDPEYSDYKNKDEILSKLNEYELELSQYGYLEFGIVYQDEHSLQEVFVTRSKYIQFWGVDSQSFFCVMADHDINLIDGLQFVHEFPMVTEPLISLDPTARETDVVVSNLRKNI